MKKVLLVLLVMLAFASLSFAGEKSKWQDLNSTTGVQVTISSVPVILTSLLQYNTTGYACRYDVYDSTYAETSKLVLRNVIIASGSYGTVLTPTNSTPLEIVFDSNSAPLYFDTALTVVPSTTSSNNLGLLFKYKTKN